MMKVRYGLTHERTSQEGRLQFSVVFSCRQYSSLKMIAGVLGVGFWYFLLEIWITHLNIGLQATNIRIRMLKLIPLYEVGPLSQRHGAFSGCGWRRLLQGMEGTANIMNKQSGLPIWSGSPNWELGVGLKILICYKMLQWVSGSDGFCSKA